MGEPWDKSCSNGTIFRPLRCPAGTSRFRGATAPRGAVSAAGLSPATQGGDAHSRPSTARHRRLARPRPDVQEPDDRHHVGVEDEPSGRLAARNPRPGRRAHESRQRARHGEQRRANIVRQARPAPGTDRRGRCDDRWTLNSSRLPSVWPARAAPRLGRTGRRPSLSPSVMLMTIGGKPSGWRPTQPSPSDRSQSAPGHRRPALGAGSNQIGNLTRLLDQPAGPSSTCRPLLDPQRLVGDSLIGTSVARRGPPKAGPTRSP